MNITQLSFFSNKHDSGNNITSKFPFIPTFEGIYEDLKPLLEIATQALEEAIRTTKEYFDSLGRDIDQFLFNDLVRYHAKWSLQTAGFSVEDYIEEFTNYELKVLANNGLSGTFNGYSFRILKADQGDLPFPASEAKSNFYNQQFQLPFPLDIPINEYSKKIRPNVLILWEVDANYNFKQLRIACPKEAGKTRDSVVAFFNEPVPHAAEFMKVKPEITEVVVDADEVQVTKKETKVASEHTK